MLRIFIQICHHKMFQDRKMNDTSVMPISQFRPVAMFAMFQEMELKYQNGVVLEVRVSRKLALS
jgi:hypothetical protein